MALKRGVGYCYNHDCEDGFKGVFLLNHGPSFFCPRCRVEGLVVPEICRTKNDSPIFREVRVEFDYFPETGHYKGMAMVRDESMKGEDLNVFYVYSPLIRTEKRALKVAEGVLANLQRCKWKTTDEGIPNSQETVIELDSERMAFKASCKRLEDELFRSSLVRSKEEEKELACR